MNKGHDILSRKLLDLYPKKADRNKAMELLESYGAGPYDKEADRVRLAILKLSGSDLDRLEHNTERAKQDYRDVLAWAEYPRQSKHWSTPDGPKKDRIIQADRDEYDEWLKT